MTELRDQLDSLSAEKIAGIVILHPRDLEQIAQGPPTDTVVNLDEAPSRRRGGRLLSMAAALLVLLIGGAILLTNTVGDDNPETTPVATAGELRGPNGEDLGIWADAIALSTTEATIGKALETDQSIVDSLTEINLCLVDSFGSEPIEQPVVRTIAAEPGTREFAETEGFGSTLFVETFERFSIEMTGCYQGRTFDGLNGPDDTREKVAATALGRVLSIILRDTEVPLGVSHADILIDGDPDISRNNATWASCMAEQGHDFPSELLARSHAFVQILNSENPRGGFEGVDFDVLRAEEASVATDAWDCSGGEAGATLRESVRQRVLANFVVEYRDDLDTELDIALLGACQAMNETIDRESGPMREQAEARALSLGCDDLDAPPNVPDPSE